MPTDLSNSASYASFALQTFVFPALQVVCLILLFVGLVLLSASVRDALGALYARIYIRRVGWDASTEARKLAATICQLLYTAPTGRLSLVKTTALATVSFLLVAGSVVNARVWYGSSVCEPPCTASLQFQMYSWDGQKPDLEKFEGLPPEGRSIILQSASPRSALPVTFAFHWVAETIAGLLFMRLVRNYRRNFLVAAPATLLIFLALLSVTPSLLSVVAVNAVGISGMQVTWDLILATQTALLNGPGLAFGGWIDPLSIGSGVARGNHLAYSLALLSSLTFATGLLAVVLANAAVRSRATLSALAFLIRNGASRPTTLILFSAGMFGLLTDASSSIGSIVKLFGSLNAWLVGAA